MPGTSAIYRPRKPQESAYYQCVENHFEVLEQVYNERLAKQYGFFRPYVQQVIYRFLDCGILHNGFARVKCGDCGHEYLLAFSCKRRHFCPSCHQKRVVDFGEWLCEDVLKAIPRRHFTFSIPKILRRYFLYDRKLFSDLSRSGWATLKAFYPAASGIPKDEAVPGAVIAIQTFGDFLGFNPHLHILISDGCFYGDGLFRVAPRFHTKTLEEIFRHKIFKMLLSKGKITEDLVQMLMSWRHSGFNEFCGSGIQPGEEKAMEILARYIIRASFSQERMSYIPEESKVNYQSKDGKQEKDFDALEWIAAMYSHVPNKGEQMARYYGYYSKLSRGKRKKRDQDGLIPNVLEPVDDPVFSGDESPDQYRKNWARLIPKIYEVDPLICPKCASQMRVISVIEKDEIIKKILNHLGLWNQKARPPPKLRPAAERIETVIDESFSQLPAPARHLSGGSDNYLYVDPEYPKVYPTHSPTELSIFAPRDTPTTS